MGVELIVTLVLIGAVGALLSGMLGIGGAIVNYPMLLYIPAWLGVAHYSPHEVAGIVALQVFFATLSGVWAVRREKLIHPKLVLYMGSAVMAGSFVGSYSAKYLPGSLINVVYAVLATIAAVMMFIPARSVEDTPVELLDFNRPIAVGSAVLVGLAAGVVGAGGAFILVPIMLQVLRIPTRITIASSLAITFVSSVGAVAGKVAAGHIPFVPALVVVTTSLLAAPLGVRLGKYVNPKVLRLLLASLIVLITIKIWSGILG